MPNPNQTQLERRVAKTVKALEKTSGAETHHDTGDPLDCLIRCILSQNTTSANCRRAYESLRERFPTWEQALAARASSIAKAIHVGGLANQKSLWIKDALKEIRRRYGKLSLEALRDMGDEEVITALTSLQGVGLKTAAIVLCFACARDVFPVDTHVHRLCKRLGFVSPQGSRERTFWDMAPLVPKGKANSFHLNLVHLGRTVCQARKPRCSDCPAGRLCDRVGIE